MSKSDAKVETPKAPEELVKAPPVADETVFTAAVEAAVAKAMKEQQTKGNDAAAHPLAGKTRKVEARHPKDPEKTISFLVKYS